MKNKYDVITFGSATQDIYLKSRNFLPVLGKTFATGEGICLTLGSKIEADELVFSSGGGGTNTAATFARQGFKTAFCGMIGSDLVGDSVIEELKSFKVDTRLILRTDKKPTDCSIIFSAGAGERTILIYHGASGQMTKKDIPWSELRTKWFYLAPLSGRLSLLTKDLVDFGRRNEIKIGFNPGKTQISLPKEELKDILSEIDILFLNQEEASILTGISYEEEKDIFKKIGELCQGVAVMTKGGRGVVVSDGSYLYKAKSLEVKPIDATGAGDSFASGFLSGFIQSKGDIEYAIQLGMANSAGCLRKIGAKGGLLKKGDKWKKIKVKKEHC